MQSMKIVWRFYFDFVGLCWWGLPPPRTPALFLEEVFALSATRLHSLSIGSGTTFPGPSRWFVSSGGRLHGKVWLARALIAPSAPCVGLFSIGSRITFANQEIFRFGLLSRHCVNQDVVKC